jgi:hypothetical protein
MAGLALLSLSGTVVDWDGLRREEEEKINLRETILEKIGLQMKRPSIRSCLSENPRLVRVVSTWNDRDV